MRKLFTYSSKVEFSLPENRRDLVEKMILELRKKLSKYSGEDADQDKNNIYFAITPTGIGITFIGIDSGEVMIDEQNDKLIVHYRLSYLSPFVPFLALDIFLIWLSFVFPPRFEVVAFAVLVSMFLFIFIFGLFYPFFRSQGLFMMFGAR